MASQGQGISIPISLQISNLQQIINDVQSKMSNLKIGSGGFRSLENTLRLLQKQLDQLQVQASKPFMTENQFTTAQRSVDKLEDEFNNLEIKISRIKFSDLNLNPDQQAQLKALQDELTNIQNSLKAVKETAKQEFLGSDLGKIWTDIDPTAMTKSLDQITSQIQRKVMDQKKLADEAQKVWQDYAKATELSNTVEKALKTKNPLENLMSSKDYNSFFSENKNGILSFKSGQRPIFEQWLIDNLQVDPNIAHNLVQQSANSIRQELKNAQSLIRQELNAKIKPTAMADEAGAKNTYNDENAKLLQLQAILNRVAQAYQEVDTNSATLRAKTEENKASVDKLQNSFVQAAQAELDVGKNSKELNNNLSMLKSTLDQSNASFLQQQRVMQSFNSMKMAVVNFMGFNQVLNITRRAVREAINHIKELDTVMNGIAIVTDMSTGDLWTQIDQYSKMAQAYGVSITGAYEVSQIYYQQGLETADVMTLTNETLKLAKISGLDYATTTDYMTTAIRGFKMEMSDAATVVDVYSNLAAHTAVSQEELAVAMSKTASSMEGVGATFEEASAMIGTMVAVTRESATNIGSAMKSIASRYGELTKDPTKLVDEEGEAMAFNKVDAALQSVGISMRTVDGQFREFTDVIVELGEKWDQLDSTQQRYIATQFAGNRQQSRFLALVSNVDLLKSNLDVAMNSEDTGTLQALKALDSIQSKTEQVRVAYQQFYTTIGIENVWKGFLDGAKNVINTLNSFPKLFGKLPVGAIAAVTNVISIIKTLGVKAIGGIAEMLGPALSNGLQAAQSNAQSGAEGIFTTILNTLKGKVGQAKEAGTEIGKAYAEGANQGAVQQKNTLKPEELNGQKAIQYGSLTKTINNLKGIKDSEFIEDEIIRMSSSLTQDQLQTIYGNQNGLSAGINEVINKLIQERAELLNVGNAAEQSNSKLQTFANKHQGFAKGLQSFGSALQMASMMIDTTAEGGKTLSGSLMSIAGAAQLAGIAMQALAQGEKFTMPWMALVTGIFAVINGISTLIVTPEERLEELTKKAEDLNNKAKETKANYRMLDAGIKKYEELKKTRYDSAEAAEAYQTAVEDLADKFPELISSFDASGNAVLEATNMEATLTKARQAAAEAAYNAAIQEREKAKLDLQNKQQALTEKQHNVGTYWSRSSDNTNIALGTVINSNGDKTALVRDTNIGAFPVKETLQSLKEQNKLNIYTEQLYNRLEEYQGSSYQLIHSLFNDINHGDIKTAQQSIILMRTLFDTMGWTLTKDFESQLTSLTNMLSEVAPLESSIEIANKTAVDSWIKKSDAYNKTPFIRDNSSLLTILENRLYNLAKEADDFSEGKLVNLGSPLISSLTALWSNLNDQTQKQVDNIINNSENYTSKDLKTILGNAVSLAPEWLYDIFDQQTKNIQANLRNKLNLVFDEKSRDSDAYNTVLDFINDTNQEFTLNEQKFLISILDQIDSINQSGFNANGLASASTTLISQISGLTTDARNALLNTILTNGFSVEGWKKTLEYITNNTDFNFSSISTSNIDTIIHESVPNYQLAATSIIGQIEEDWTDIDKFFSSLSKGVNKTEIGSLLNQAQSLGITELQETDFVSNGEDMIVNATKIEALMNDKKESLKLQIDNLITDLNDTYHTLQDIPFDLITPIDGDNLINQEILDADYLKQYQRILGSDFDNYFKKNEHGELEAILQEGETLEEADTRIWNAVYLHYQNNLSALQGVNSYYDILFNNLSKSLKWKRGDYSSLLDTKLYASVTDVETRLLALASGIELSDDELKQPDVAAARDQVREAYNKLISDIFDKGMENIKLSDYEGIIGISQEDITGTYENFILTYAKRANYSIKQMNEAWLNAIEKDNAKFSNDAIKDLQFVNKNQFQASSSELKDLAERFNIDLSNEQVRQFIHYNKDLGEFIVDWTNISELQKGLPEVSGYEDTVKDSINSFFDGLISLINNALSGSLTNADASKLSLEAEQYLGITDLDFTETAEGLKLSEKSAIELYDALKKTDSLKAKLVFKELNKSLQETNKHYKTIGSLQARIVELEKIAPDARSEEYKRELELAKEIYSIRSITDEDSSFNFMSADIPGMQKNPLNYWKNIGEMWSSFQDAFKAGPDKGLMDAESFYRIMTHFGEMVEASGEPIQLGADKWIRSTEDAANLISEGYSNIKIASDNSAKIDLGEIGINFEASAGDMGKGIDAGIKAIAQAQIKTIDAAIAMLEAIEAMQSIGDIDLDNDNKISFGEIFDLEKGGQIRSEIQEWMNLLTSNFGITVNGETLPAKLFNQLNPEQLSNFFTRLHEIITNPEVDPSTLPSQLQELIKSFFPEETVVVGDGALQKLGINTETYKNGLYEKIISAVKQGSTLDSTTRNNIVEEIKKQNETLGTTLETILNTNNQLSLKDALEIAAIITETGVITKNADGSYVVNYPGFEGATSYKTIDAAQAALTKYLQTEQLIPDSTINAKGTTITLENGVTINGIASGINGKITYTYNGLSATFTSDTSSETISKFFKDNASAVTPETVTGENSETTVESEAVINHTITYDQENDTWSVDGTTIEGSCKSVKEAVEKYQAQTPSSTSETDTSNAEYDRTETLTYNIKVNGTNYTITKDSNGQISVDGVALNGQSLEERIKQLAKVDELDNVTIGEIKQIVEVEIDYQIKKDPHADLKKNILSASDTTLTNMIGHMYSSNGNINRDTELGGLLYEYNSRLLKGGTLNANELAVVQKINSQASSESGELRSLLNLILGNNEYNINELNNTGASSVLESLSTALGEISITDLQSIISELNNLQAVLSTLESIDLSNVIQTINDIQKVINEDIGEGELTLNIKLTDAQKEEIEGKINELITLATTPQNMPIVPKIDEEVIKNYTVPEKIMYIRQKIIEASGGSASGNLENHRRHSSDVFFANEHEATGNLGIANAKGTLMGELGPELVVSNGRYFVAGQKGPEMVNLADDAIVFNHLQTKSLLEKGMSSGRGEAVTNERKAVAFAKGSIHGGPAMDIGSTIATLKQLRSEWQSLLNMSIKDLAGKGGGGGGGGDPKAFIKDLERWYNWLQQIAQLEKEINLEEAKRSRYQSSMISMGREYADSQLVTIDKLKQQIAVQESLNRSQEAYFEKRRKELNENSAFKALYQFDENGQLKYKPGQFEWLSDLVGRDSVTGEANYTAKEQYERLVAAGYGEQMKYDASGNEIKQEGDDWYVTAIQAFWDKIEAERQEMQSLHDDVLDGQVKEEELMTDQNEILNDIEDNQIAVEDKVLKAVEETRQREIDAIQDEKDAIEKSSQALINGLSDQLSKEQDMYSRQQDSNELSRLQRQLSILQRSGGSASQIASLQKDITERQQDAYFDAQKAQIDALQEASDNQLQKLQEQIDLMTEQLAYEKQHGMLWEQVYQVMSQSPEYITDFITKNTEEYWGKSPADFAEDSREVLFQAEQFVEMRKKVEGGLAALVAANSPEAIAAESEKITAESETQQASTTDTVPTNTNTTSTTDTSGNGNNSDITGYYYKSAGAQGHYLMAMMADGSQQQKSGLQEHTFSGNKCTKCYYEQVKKKIEGGGSYRMYFANSKESPVLMASGGLVTHPTHALIGETGKPEAVLNPEQTSILRNEILGNKPNSALSMLSDLRELWNAAERTANISHTNDASVIIENATVEMNVSRIANDYDAQRAGEQALDQMLAIARKTQAQNRVGR